MFAVLSTCSILIRGQAVSGSLMATIWGVNVSGLSCVPYDWQSVIPGVNNAQCASSFYVAHLFVQNDAYAVSYGAGFDSRTTQHMRWSITIFTLLLIFFFWLRVCIKIKSCNLNPRILQIGPRINSRAKLMILLVSVSKNMYQNFFRQIMKDSKNVLNTCMLLWKIIGKEVKRYNSSSNWHFLQKVRTTQAKRNTYCRSEAQLK